MVVLGVLRGHSTKTTSDFADVDRHTVQLWVTRFSEGGISGLRDAPARCKISSAWYGWIRRPACQQEHVHPKKAAELNTRQNACQIQPVQHAQGPVLPRIFIQEISYPVCFGYRCQHGKVMAGRCRRRNIGGKKAFAYDSDAERTYIS